MPDHIAEDYPSIAARWKEIQAENDAKLRGKAPVEQKKEPDPMGTDELIYFGW